MNTHENPQKKTISRRGALGTGAITALSAATASITGQKASAQGRSGKPKNLHVSLAAYSMRQMLQKGDMDLFGFIDWCAELDLSGTELTSYYFKEDFGTPYLHELRKRAFDQGVTVSGTAIRNNFCRPDGPEKRQDIDNVKRWIDHAAELFAPHIRIFAGNLPEGTEKNTGIEWVADGIRACLDYAGERGIYLGLENHGGITARVADHLAICDAVGEHPWFGVNLDTGNYRTNAYEELAIAAPRAVNVQVKVEVFEYDGGPKVLADLPRVRDIIVRSGYKGWIALEYEAEGDPKEEIPMYLRRMNELFES